MSKTIKLEDQTYRRLDDLRGKRETFNQVVERLVSILEAFQGIEPIVRGNQAYLESLKQY